MNISVRESKEMSLVTFTEKKQKRFKQKAYAPLEPKTQKILQKLKKRLQQIDEKITTEKLNESKEKIHYWLKRHSAHRIALKGKELKVFTEGQNPAKLSRRIENFKNHLRSVFFEAQDTSQNLKGRVSKST